MLSMGMQLCNFAKPSHTSSLGYSSHLSLSARLNLFPRPPGSGGDGGTEVKATCLPKEGFGSKLKV